MLRFAISPTRDMHIGNLRVAILNFLVAQQRNIGFIIRMDDTDKTKNIEGKDTEIMQILEKFALNHESVFHQSEHLHMHQTLAIKLLEQDKAFVCTCVSDASHDAPYSGKCYDVDKSELAKLKSSGTPFVIRIKQPSEDVVFDDLIQGAITHTPSEIDSFVILKEDGTPTQTFASACDDMLSGITTLICEDDVLLDTARQIHTKKLLGFDTQMEYAHIPIIPKMNDDASLKGLFSHGFIPDAIINYLLLLGNTHSPSEIFTLPEAVEWFDIKNISKGTVDFDSEKLRFINRQHLLQMDDKALSTLFGFADADIGKLAKLYLKEVSTSKELEIKIKAIFSPKDFSSHWGEQMRTLENVIQNAPMFSKFNDFTSYIMLKSEFKDGDLFIPLRLLLTGAEHGPELSYIYPLIKSYLLEIAS